MAFTGVIRDQRTTDARALLSRMYGGRRVDALDPLLLPPIEAAPAATVDQRLAASLPTFHAGYVLAPDAASDEAILRALLERGVPLPMRAALREKKGALKPSALGLAARARIALGIRTWRGVDFDEAIAHVTAIPEDDRKPEHRLLLALGLALRKGPEDVVELMKAKGAQPARFGDVRALDSIANGSGALAGQAAFDAALLREIAAPPGAPAAYFKDAANRWRKAARLAKDDQARATAEDRAAAMDAIAAELK
jgi:hypothetical protein